MGWIIFLIVLFLIGIYFLFASGGNPIAFFAVLIVALILVCVILRKVVGGIFLFISSHPVITVLIVLFSIVWCCVSYYPPKKPSPGKWGCSEKKERGSPYSTGNSNYPPKNPSPGERDDSEEKEGGFSYSTGDSKSEKKYVYLELENASEDTVVQCHIWDSDRPWNEKIKTIDYNSSSDRYCCKLPKRIDNPVLQFSAYGKNSPVYEAEPNRVYWMSVNGEMGPGYDSEPNKEGFDSDQDLNDSDEIFSNEYFDNGERCPDYDSESDKEDNPLKSEHQSPKENNGNHNGKAGKRRNPYANLTSLPHSEEGFDLEYQDLKDLDKVVKNCVIIVDTCTFMGLDDSPEAFSNFFARIKPCLEDNGRWFLYHKATAAELARLQKETYNPKDLSSNRLSNRCESARQAVAFIKDNKNLIREYEDTKGAATHADAHFLTTAILNKRDYQFLFLTYDKDCKAALLAENENLSNAGHKILVGNLSPKGKIKE